MVLSVLIDFGQQTRKVETERSMWQHKTEVSVLRYI